MAVIKVSKALSCPIAHMPHLQRSGRLSREKLVARPPLRSALPNRLRHTRSDKPHYAFRRRVIHHPVSRMSADDTVQRRGVVVYPAFQLRQLC